MNKNKLRILLMIPLLIIVSILAYVYLPNVSNAVEHALDAVGAITVPTSSTETKEQIHEHRGYGIFSTSSATETVTYENAAGNTGITNINSYLSEYLNDAYDWNLGWYFSLQYNTSIFCQEKGTPFPNLNNKYLELFHSGKYDTNELTVGAKHDDYLELWENIACTSNSVTALEEDYPDDGIVPRTKEVLEAEITDSGKMISYYQFTLVRVNYKATARTFDTPESYIFTYSLRNFYRYNPAQVAIWKYKNNKDVTDSYSGAAKGTGLTLYKAAKAVDELKTPTKPEMSVTTDNTASKKTGTVIDETKTKYKVGPIYMNQYTYGYSEHIKDYSGDSALKNPNNADMISRMDAAQKATFQGIICGIVEAKVELDNGETIYLTKDNFVYSEQDSGQLTFSNEYYESPARKGYQFPTPNSKFYILLNIADCKGATYIKKITMKYKWTTADGNGGDLDGVYDELQWTNKWDGAKFTHATYHCDNTYNNYPCVNDNLDWSDRSTFPGDTFHGNVNKHAHDFWCGAGDTHCQYGSKATTTGYNNIGVPDKMSGSCDWTYTCGKTAHDHDTDVNGNKSGGQVNNTCNTSACPHVHNSTDGVGSCCSKKVHTHTVGCNDNDCSHPNCTYGSPCKKSTSNNPPNCTHQCTSSCCDIDYHKHGSGCNTSDCDHKHNYSYGSGSCCSLGEHNHDTSRCGKKHECPKTYCIHGHSEGKHKGDHSWSWADHIHECKGPEGVGTRCNCHPDADGGGHRNCYMFSWECIRETPDIHSQRLMYVSDAQVYEHNMECYIGDIPLVCKVEINKYVYDVNHVQLVGSTDTTYAASDARADLSGGQGTTDKEKFEASEKAKKENPVYVEFGDLVTYKIVLTNSSDFGVKVRIDDVLPTGNYVFKNAYMGSTKINSVADLRKTIITVGAESEASFTVTIQVEDLKGTYENLAKIITRNGPTKNENSDDVDYVRTVDDDGPVVNHIDTKCDGTTTEPRIESRDYYTLNNYNTFVDKFVHKYDQLKQEENNADGFTNEPSIVNSDDTLKTSRQNTNTATEQYDDPNDDFLVDTRRQDNGAQETKKAEHPLNVEKYETITYAIKISNEAKKVEAAIDSGDKYATQVRPTKVTDKMHRGLSYQNITATVYKADGTVKQNSLGVKCTKTGTEGDLNVYELTLDNSTILDAGEYVLFLIEAKVVQSNMYLPAMENSAELTMITNVNNKAENDRDVTTRNISQHQITKEYVRMKDLIIAGKVWVDFNRDGLMNETASADQRDFYGVDSAGMKDGIVVNLYRLNSQSSDAATKIRTTKTDADGFFTFGRNQAFAYYQPFNETVQYNSGTYYQRIDKASGKDSNGNYTDGSEYYRYYIEYEYDGVMYKSTEFYAGMKNLKQNDGRYDPEYLIDSNAAELEEDREDFNKLYEYISYDVAYDLSMGTQNGGNLSFDKDDHISTLIENEARKMTAKSFVIKSSDDTQRIKYLWLYSFNGGVDNTIPETDYLKFINLGLELREDVDIALSKDVYSVKTTIDGEEVEYSLNQLDILNGQGSNKDYIIDKPYGLELYESDYKKRTDQYASQAVRNYKGTESELNVEVTYRMTLNNIPVRDDYKMSTSTDTKLFAKIHEVLDLYDENFMTYSDSATVTVKTKDANGFLKDKTVKVSEAWYFKEGGSGTKYSISNEDEVAKGAKPFYVEDPNGTYTKVNLVVSNTSSRGAKGAFSNKANNFTSDGYKTMYIRGMENVVLAEGEELDIYVKYTVDKGASEVKVSSSYSETKSERSSSSININGNTQEFAVQGASTTSTNVTLHRALRIADKKNKPVDTARGTENIAQINAYSIWYDQAATEPASIVDVDSNAGNIGVTNGEGSKNVGSADDIDLYEDTAYKTGIEITAENTENDPDTINTKYGERVIIKLRDLTRMITGKVWDDSRTETMTTGSGDVYHGDGMSNTSNAKTNGGQTNINVETNYDVATTTPEKKEQVDIPVRSAKAEFVEIIQTAPDRYYEQVLTDVTWEQKQHDRTDAKGEYILEGLTPGRYIVRFTYGDTVGANEDGVENVAQATKDMQIFNGQDYKSTKYTLELENGQLSVDDVIKRFNDEYTSDARDDEMRRLTVNKYSEVMTNEKAEILKGLINNTRGLIDTRYNPVANNTDSELKALTDNTYMEAETVEFTIKPEKLLAEAAYYREATKEERAAGSGKVKRVDYNDTNGVQVEKYTSVLNDIYYNALEIIKNSDIYDRAFTIYNLDFGIEYRPESQISLTKEINQMKLTAEDGTVLVDLFFNTSKDATGKTVHSIDKEKSKGLDVVQFITNDYTNFAQALIKDIKNEEHTQGFVYIQVDDEILQGATVEITYKFYAQNNSELDLIRDKLDVIRYKENKQTTEVVNKYGEQILDTTYTASGTAENILFAEMYKLDEFATGSDVEENKDNLYRTKQKLLIDKTTDEGYFGRFVGYGYYTGENFDKDVIASLKFDKILDYIDTNLEFKQETNNDLLENKFWTITNPAELKPYVYALRKGGIDLTPVGTLTNVEGQEYKALVVSVDDSLYDNIEGRIPANAETLGNGIVNNKALSRFLLPEKADKTPDKTQSTGYIYLPTSKVIAAETDTDNLQYENIAEIIQFTTLTGRRTNFETTIGNANIHATTPSNPSKGSIEFDTAALEPDTAATETITLTPPTGLMLSRRKIVNVVDTAAKGVGITVIVAAVVAVVFGITIVTRTIIKKRRIK